MGRLAWTVRLSGGLIALGLIVARVGTGPFVQAVTALDPRALVLALLVTAVTTVCCARRWTLVSASLGSPPPSLGVAVAAYYRSQFLNATLPGGVLGDVHRGLRHRPEGSRAKGLRAVVWERSAGMAVQVVATVLVVTLPFVGAPLRPALLLAALLPVLWLPRPGREICLLSLAAVAGHALLFLIAARTAGVTLGAATMAPLALIVLLVSAVPLNVAGWGPREGAAAWAFGLVGLGAAQGVTVSVVYGVMALVAVLPGAVVLLVGGGARTLAPEVRHG